MIRIDMELLDELGLGALPESEKRSLLKAMYEQIEIRVGATLAARMTDEQLTDFERFVDAGDQGGALRSLEEHFPDYQATVASVFEEVKSEIADRAGTILGAFDRSEKD